MVCSGVISVMTYIQNTRIHSVGRTKNSECYTGMLHFTKLKSRVSVVCPSFRPSLFTFISIGGVSRHYITMISSSLSSCSWATFDPFRSLTSRTHFSCLPWFPLPSGVYFLLSRVICYEAFSVPKYIFKFLQSYCRRISLESFADTEFSEIFSGRQPRQDVTFFRNIGKFSDPDAAVCPRKFHWIL
jgi:hypothetical protein